MSDVRLGAVERRFADLIWDSQPLSSGELVRLAEKELNWKKSTTFTVLKRLCEKGLFQNLGGTVSACISREAFCAAQSEKFVEETFQGSLPAFLAAFTARKALKPEEVAQLRRLVEAYEEG